MDCPLDPSSASARDAPVLTMATLPSSATTVPVSTARSVVSGPAVVPSNVASNRVFWRMLAVAGDAGAISSAERPKTTARNAEKRRTNQGCRECMMASSSWRYLPTNTSGVDGERGRLRKGEVCRAHKTEQGAGYMVWRHSPARDVDGATTT